MLLLCACVSQTKHQRLHPCYSPLSKDDIVLIDEIPGVGMQESYRLYQYAAKVLATQGIEARYVQEEEYNMARLGIRGFSDTSRYALLRDSLGIRHLLSIKVTTSSKGDFYEKTTAEELQPARAGKPLAGRSSQVDNPENKARLLFRLTPLAAARHTPDYTLTTTTTMSAVSLKEKDGDVTDYNFSTTGMATYKALKKGLKKLMSACNG